ncbi:MAG: radical SAM protein [Candidatus Sericytochromatia bacterium]
MHRYCLHPDTVLRPEPDGALWFHRRSAETLELDCRGLEELLRLLAGRPTFGWRAWNFRNLLRARGFVRLTQGDDGNREDLVLVRDCLARAGDLGVPLRSRSAPEVLHISLTDACSQRCSGCFFSNREPGIRPNRYLAFARFERIVAVAARYRVFQLALGGGEPLMHPQLEALVAHGTRAGLVVNLTSSGALLSRAKALALKAAGLGQLQLSLNGATAASHGLTRPGFEAVLAAMGHCRDTSLRFGLNLLVTRQNLDELEAMLSLARAQGAWSVNLLRPKPSPEEPDWLEQTLPDSAGNHRLQQIIRRWQKKAPFLLQTDTSLTFLRQGRVEELAAAGLGGCSAGRRMLSIGVDGRVSPCGHIPMYDETEDDEDFMSAWRTSPHLERFRRLEESLKGACASCELKAVCRGCRAIVWAQSGDFDGEDLQCPKRLPISSWPS